MKAFTSVATRRPLATAASFAPRAFHASAPAPLRPYLVRSQAGAQGGGSPVMQRVVTGKGVKWYSDQFPGRKFSRKKAALQAEADLRRRRLQQQREAEEAAAKRKHESSTDEEDEYRHRHKKQRVVLSSSDESSSSSSSSEDDAQPQASTAPRRMVVVKRKAPSKTKMSEDESSEDEQVSAKQARKPAPTIVLSSSSEEEEESSSDEKRKPVARPVKKPRPTPAKKSPIVLSSSSEEESSSSSEDESTSSEEDAPQKVVVKKPAPKKPAPKPAVKKRRIAPKKAKARDSDDSGSENDGDTEDNGGEMDSVVAYSGVKQQGKVSKSHGKAYLAPGSYKGRRSEQVGRHVTNLVLSRLTEEARQDEVPRKHWEKKYRKQLKFARAKLKLGAKAGKKSDPKEKEAALKATKRVTDKLGPKPPTSKHKPVEVQMSMVGGRALMNTNNPLASQRLSEGIRKAGSLLAYLNLAEGDGFDASHSSLKPAMDKDATRPLRYQSKLASALKGERHWQKKGAKGENEADLRRSQALLKAIASTGVGDLNPNDGTMKQTVKNWKAKDAPLLYIPHHKDKVDDSHIPNEHAERVQSEIRAEHLGPFEKDGESMGPVGPKTPCLGCETKHRVHYHDFAPESSVSGALFSGSSPIRSAEEVRIGKQLATSRPATGSVSVYGGTRNSDHQDSDTDDEGNRHEWLPQEERQLFDDAGKMAPLKDKRKPLLNAKGKTKLFSVPELKKQSTKDFAAMKKRRQEAVKRKRQSSSSEEEEESS